MEGENHIKLVIRSAVTEAAARAAAYPYPVPFVQAQPLSPQHCAEFLR